MPDTAQKIKNMLSVPEYEWEPKKNISGAAGEDRFSEYKWEPSEIKGDFKVKNLELLFERLI
jgi:hypothetical protein